MKAIFLILLFAASCSINPYVPAGIADFFYVQSQGIDMPVWIKGNTNSDTTVVFLQGGPGAESAGVWNYPCYIELQKKYRFVYFDQRSAGVTLGSPGDETLAPEQVAVDTERVIRVVKARYSPRSIFLLGHSGGGMMGTAFLTNSSRQALVKGWIEMDGAHNWKLGMKLSYEWASNRAEQYSSDASFPDADRAYWSNAIRWYASHSPDRMAMSMGFIPDDWSAHYAYVSRGNGYFLRANSNIVSLLNGYTVDQKGTLSAFYRPGTLRWFCTQVWTNDVSPNMGKITLPTLICWGKQDGILPVALATNAYQLIGTPPADKYLAIFTNSGHMPNIEEKDRFVAEMTNFIEKYR